MSATNMIPTATLHAAGSWRLRCALWALLYALAIVYASTVVSPLGFHYVPLDPDVAWQRLLASTYDSFGPSQRPDWMANLLMLVPLGFLTAAGFSPSRRSPTSVLTALIALALCLGFVIAVKYAQLFFPPRTVNLNYILAQSLGVTIGVAAFLTTQDRLQRIRQRLARGGHRAFIALLWLYLAALLAITAFPFETPLDVHELRARFTDFHWLFTILPAPGRSLPQRAAIGLAGMAALVPIGALAVLRTTLATTARVSRFGIGVLILFAISAISFTSATPIPLPLAIPGFAFGALTMAWLRRRDPAQVRRVLRRLVPLAVLPYVVAVLAVNNLLTPHWRTPDEAMAALDLRGLLPFWHDYIVSKAQALVSLLVHVTMYAPIGVMLWLRRGDTRGARWTAAVLAFVLAFAVEVGRWLKPDLQPDFNEAPIAAAAAWFAVRLAGYFWSGIGPAQAPTMEFVRQPEPVRRSAGLAVLPGIVFCAAGLALAGLHPVAPIALAGAVLVYMAALWRWPSLWLAVIPAVLPALDLSAWSGWLFAAECDPFILATVGILLMRTPLVRADFNFGRGIGAVLIVLIIAQAIGILAGLAAPPLPGGSSNPYLMPENALRLAKGVATALVLLPFLRQRQREYGDALARLGWGMTLGLLAVGLAVVFERALFVNVLDLFSDYRVIGPFASMHKGGGIIGTYFAMTIPFLLVPLIGRSWFGRLLGVAIAALATYALIVTFARTAYASAALGLVVTFLVTAVASRHGARLLAVGMFAGLVCLVGGGIIIGVGTPMMSARIASVLPDFSVRDGNWQSGLQLEDGSLQTMLIGTGSGTYPRLALLAPGIAHKPTNFVLLRDAAGPYLRLQPHSPLFFGQKIPIEPNETLTISATIRSPDGHGLHTSVCEKWLLYSVDCVTTALPSSTAGTWQPVSTTLSTGTLGTKRLFGALARPTEFSIFGDTGTTIDIRALSLRTGAGTELLRNGDFSDGRARWYFTDDDHLAWRILNQYVMLLVEDGLVGLLAFVLVAVVAFRGAVLCVRSGIAAAAPLAGMIAAFAFSGLFDFLFEAPRLSALFYLGCFAAVAASPASLSRRHPID